MKSNITQLPIYITKVKIAHTKKGYVNKPAKPKGKVIIKTYNLKELVEAIKTGHIFSRIYDIGQIRMNINSFFPSSTNYDPQKYFGRKNLLKDLDLGCPPIRIFQRKSIVEKCCTFQCVFFDIDECEYRDSQDVIRMLELKPNIIYQTYSYTPEKPRYRLVYILDEELPCIIYSEVYDAIKRKLGKTFKFDNCCRNATQTIYSTYNKEVRIVSEYYYHYESLLPADAQACSLPLNEMGSTNCAAEKTPSTICGLQIQNVEDSSSQTEQQDNGREMYLNSVFYSYLMTHSIDEFLDHYKIGSPKSTDYQCVCVEFETPNDINEKFIINSEGLLSLPKYYNGVKLVLNDHRKKFIREVTTLILMMCPDIIQEDLVYSVFAWAKEHISFCRERNKHPLNNKIIVDLIKEAYKSFNAKNRTPNYEDHLRYLENRNRRSQYKKAINPYYKWLHFGQRTFFRSYYEHLFNNVEFEYCSIEDLHQEMKKIRIPRKKSEQRRSDVGKEHAKYRGSKKSKCILMMEQGCSRDEIISTLGITGGYFNKIKQYLRQIEKVA